MELHALTLDDFFHRPDMLWKIVTQLEYKTLRHMDGVEYPYVTDQVPESYLDEAKRKLGVALNGRVKFKVTALRLSPEGVNPPHWAHTDLVVSQYLAIVYMTKNPPADAGTALVEHIATGLRVNPQNEEELNWWKADVNDESKWRVTDFCAMRYNRCFIVPTHLFHAALPRNGFGMTARDGRLVMIAFFDCEGR